jgi:ABC-type multidrug transport system fused ATPase/permease subunit
MFSGTLRYNLDPFHMYSDSDVWEALDRVQLKDDIISKFPKKLDHEVNI